MGLNAQFSRPRKGLGLNELQMDSIHAIVTFVASRPDWQKAGMSRETVVDMIEKGLLVDHPLIGWRFRARPVAKRA